MIGGDGSDLGDQSVTEIEIRQQIGHTQNNDQ